MRRLRNTEHDAQWPAAKHILGCPPLTCDEYVADVSVVVSMAWLADARNKVFLAVGIMGLLAILSSTMSKNPVLNLFAASLGTPEAWSGIVASASTIPGILASLPAASLSDVVGRKKMLLASGFLFASAPFAYLFVTDWWQLIPVRFYHGFATAVFVPVAEASVAELFPDKRGERLSLFSSVTSVGRVAAPFLGGYILFATGQSFSTLYLGVAAAGVSAFIIGAVLLAEERGLVSGRQTRDAQKHVRLVFRGWRTVTRNRGVLATSVVQASQYYVFGAVEFFLVGYMKDVGLDSLLIGAVMGVQLAGATIVKPLIGRLSDRIGRRTPIILGSVMGGLPLLAVPFARDFSVLLALSATYGLGFASVTACTSALASELAGADNVGTAMGFIDTIMDVGQTAGPIVTGLITATSLGYAASFPALTAVMLLSCLVFVASRVGAKSTIQSEFVLRP